MSTIETNAETIRSTAVPPPAPPAVRLALARLRAMIRRYLWLEGIAAIAIFLAAAFWINLAVDWFFEPNRDWRVAFLFGGAVALIGVCVVFIGRRVFHPFPDQSLALLVERRFSELNENLLTVVELTAPEKGAASFHPEMFSRVCETAAEAVAAMPLERILNPRPLRRKLVAALVLAGAIAVLCLTMPEVVRFWFARAFALSEELWPRATHLRIDGFDDGCVKVGRNADLDLHARVDLAESTVVPANVQVRYAVEGGSQTRAVMNRLGVADPDKDPWQEYSYTFRGLIAPVRFDVIAGDAAVRGLRILVVDNPAITMDIECEYPAYTGRKATRNPASGSVSLPRGSRVVVHAAANKDLVRVQVDRTVGDQAGLPEWIDFSADSTDRRHFRYAVDALDKETTLLFSLSDADGIKTREPIRLSLTPIADDPPRVAVQLQGVGPAITPRARLPLSGEIHDDYSIARVWLEHAVDKGAARQTPIVIRKPGACDLRLVELVDVEPLELKPGQQLTASVKAADGCTLSAGANIGSGERWILDVVTDVQLRTMLESRELALRQRFEAIIQEVLETRDLVIRVDAPPEKGKPEPSGDLEGGPPSAERLAAMRNLRLDRAVQNGRKNAHETQGIAESFEEICRQFINNRIDTEEMTARLRNRIAEPLRAIVDRRFPEIERDLEKMRSSAEDETLRNAAREKIDDLLTELRAIREQMLKLESFNEAVELLRGILESQEKLNEQTKSRQKQKLRDLIQE